MDWADSSNWPGRVWGSLPPPLKGASSRPCTPSARALLHPGGPCWACARPASLCLQSTSSRVRGSTATPTPLPAGPILLMSRLCLGGAGEVRLFFWRKGGWKWHPNPGRTCPTKKSPQNGAVALTSHLPDSVMQCCPLLATRFGPPRVRQRNSGRELASLPRGPSRL